MSLPTITEMVAVLGYPQYFFSQEVFDVAVISVEEQGDGFGMGYGWSWGDGVTWWNDYEPA